MTRKEAKQTDEKFYIPGRLCKRCSTAKRYTKTGQCVTCHSVWSSEYAKSNKAKINDRARINWATNERRKTRQRFWQQANREKCRKASSNWAKNNSAKTAALVGKRRAVKRKACPAWVNKKKLQEIYEKAKQMSKLTGVQYHVDHIVPLQHELVCGLHVPWNLQILTAEENIAKANSLK